MRIHLLLWGVLLGLATPVLSSAAAVTTAGQPAVLEVRPAGPGVVRVSLKPRHLGPGLPAHPALVGLPGEPVLRLTELTAPAEQVVAGLLVSVQADPIRVTVRAADGRLVQELQFDPNGTAMRFRLDDGPVLGLGEGGPRGGRDWRSAPVEFDRRGRLHQMQPRWQDDAYGSRNPVALLIGTSGWALFVAAPWGQIDLRDPDHGRLTAWSPPPAPVIDPSDDRQTRQRLRRRYTAQVQGRPPVDSLRPGLFDVLVFDAKNPQRFMKAVSVLTGPAVLPPKWALGYMQSHRTLQDDRQMVEIVRTFRGKALPLDAVIYLGTGFCPRGWNTPQPSLRFNPEVFTRQPREVIEQLHDLHTRVVLHVVPWGRDRLARLEGPMTADSPARRYWGEHLELVRAGIDGWWPDEGDWFDLGERFKRHEMYYLGPLQAQPDRRPWSLHRNGHLGIARWGGWVWSGDTQSTWKTLQAQIAVGLNHSLSLSPYWGSDIGGFYPTRELTGQLYARWFQFGAFCPSFRAHGRTWWLRLPWGWGLDRTCPVEHPEGPDPNALNDPTIEPICRQYLELRYRLLPYTYSLAWQARQTGMPLMRALWLHYPDEPDLRGLADEYLWGPDLLVAPVYRPDAHSRRVVLPPGRWFDWWTRRVHTGPGIVERPVDLSVMPLYVRAGAIIPFDPVRQYTDEPVSEPTRLLVFTGADGHFELYDDDGLSLAYLAGHHQRIACTWQDGPRRLRLEPAGSPPRDPQARDLTVELIPDGPTRRVTYRGQALAIDFATSP